MPARFWPIQRMIVDVFVGFPPEAVTVRSIFGSQRASRAGFDKWQRAAASVAKLRTNQ
jgi:hypothetical protein